MKNQTAVKCREKLTEVCRELITQHNVDRFISGGALGTDTYGFIVVHQLKKEFPHIKNILSIPFKKQDKVWSPEQKKFYQQMKDKADEIIYVDELPQYQVKVETNGERVPLPIGDYDIKKMQKRNEHMVDNSRFVIAVYDGSKGGTKNCLYYAHKMMNSIYRLNPKFDFELTVSWGLK